MRQNQETEDRWAEWQHKGRAMTPAGDGTCDGLPSSRFPCY